jgi:hypothetical protein
MDKQNLSEELRVSFKLFMETLEEISNRLNLEPVLYPRNVTITQYGAQWGRCSILVYLKNHKVFYSFNHPVEEEYARNDTGRSGNHTFENYQQCLQSLVQHRTFELVKDVYDQRKL